MVDTVLMLTNQTDTRNEHVELQNFNLLQNYSVLLNKLEQLALDVDKELELSLANVDLMSSGDMSSSGSSGPHISYTHGLDEIEYTRVVSDIWVGIILTLLVVCVIILLCAGFLYHKFQQWKSTYRSNRSPDPIEICRSYPPNYEVESLPSYTIVSGLPTYDDALEEFRKAGIILTPQIPVIKIFEAKDGKNKDLYGIDNNLGDSNTCTCVASNNANNLLAPPMTPPPPPPPPLPTNTTNTNAHQLIELTPEQLAQLSQKRLSLQIAFGSQMQRNSRSRHDMRNQLLRSRAYSNNITVTDSTPTAPVHRPRSSASFSSPTSNNEC